eukprot:TRINITY_DN114030_c0_g1_i1.p1 TRINITY_DN114030_c0_g1~~TRINITY_DN114030_c0_g1_i1.p1  ORF type:complete len:218 (-),score=51.03 TRINITY_DN114030_c0_g1_i1:21-644(-)
MGSGGAKGKGSSRAKGKGGKGDRLAGGARPMPRISISKKGWGKDSSKSKSSGGSTKGSKNGSRPGSGLDWMRRGVARKGGRKGPGGAAGGKSGQEGSSGGKSSSSLPHGHAIMLIQYSDRATGKTYAEHDDVSAAMDGVCQTYEQVLKMGPGAKAQAKYTVEDLWSFVDDLPDIACLVYNQQMGEYVPHNRDWIKNQALKHLKGQLS